MATYYDRYSNFRVNGSMNPIPGLTIPQSNTDKFYIYRQGQSRLDKVSNLYYNTPYAGWLILLANPEYGGLEFNIPDMTSIRIPYPYQSALDSYLTQINTYLALYGQ